METDDAGGPNSKRRKLTEAESTEVAAAPATTEAADPDLAATERSTRDEEPLPGAGVDEEGGGVDRISDLPDPILGEIISFLPTRKGARTQVLSSRWRHLWRSAPLNLDCRRLPDDRRMRDDVVSHILSTHPGPARRFRLPAYYVDDRAAAVDTWLRSPVLDNLQELDFCNVWHYRPTGQLPSLAPPPASAFRFSATLHSFTIGRCRLPDSTVQALHFPQLKQLALERVCISECSLSRLIAGCPTLECLLIFYSSGFSCARINSVSLRSIGVRLCQHRGFHCHQTNEVQFRKLVMEDAPCLERLLRLNLFDGLHVSVISAPKLRTLGYLFNRMNYSSTLTQQLPHDSLTTVVGSVKVLAVNIFILDLDSTLELMKCFPFLEKLYITSVSGDKNLWIRKHRDLIRGLDIRLKTVVLESYRGIKAQVSFAKFFIMNAKMLETMIFQVQIEDYYRGFVTQQRKKLQLEKSTSKSAQFHFTTDRYIRCHSIINHVRYLDLADPFVCEP